MRSWYGSGDCSGCEGEEKREDKWGSGGLHPGFFCVFYNPCETCMEVDVRSRLMELGMMLETRVQVYIFCLAMSEHQTSPKPLSLWSILFVFIFRARSGNDIWLALRDISCARGRGKAVT